MNQEQYIEHEVQLRVHNERFKFLEDSIININQKINWLIGVIVGVMIIPIVLHHYGLI